MNTEMILRLLKNSGIIVRGADAKAIYIEDPGCILRSFETFIEYAWIIISVITAILLFGWAVSMIRGAKNDIWRNMRNLVLMFGTLSAAVPIVNLIWGDDLFARGCRTIAVPRADIDAILAARDAKLSRPTDDLYEEFDIYDSGARPDAPDAGTVETPMVPVGRAPDTPGASTPASPAQPAGPARPNPVASPVAPSTPDAPGRSAPIATHPAGDMPTPTAATAAGRDVIYTTADGTKYRRHGGTRAWRNINPGNIRYTELARRLGAIGAAGGFAVFPDEQTGMNAIGRLLRSSRYNNLTIAAAISRYAPPSENDTAGYHRRVRQLTGLDINRRVSDLSDAELARVASAIREIEGWTPGTTTKMS